MAPQEKKSTLNMCIFYTRSMIFGCMLEFTLFTDGFCLFMVKDTCLIQLTLVLVGGSKGLQAVNVKEFFNALLSLDSERP